MLDFVAGLSSERQIWTVGTLRTPLRRDVLPPPRRQRQVNVRPGLRYRCR